MRFTRHGDLLRVTHVSGPTHNLLGLRLASAPSTVSIESLSDGGPAGLPSEQVRQAVEAGVRQAAEEFGLQAHVQTIQFVPSDGGPAHRYETLAYVLIRHFVDELRARDPAMRLPAAARQRDLPDTRVRRGAG